MSASVQSFTSTAGTYTFSSTGRPHYAQKSVFEAAERRGLPRRKIVRHTITQWFKEATWADNQARFAALKSALSVAEGTLLITDEAGNARVNNLRVRVLAHDLPEQWGEFMQEVKVEFEGVEEIGLSGQGATFTPTGGSAIPLGDVRDWKVKVDTTRYSEYVPNRRESRLAVSARGSIRANPADTPSDRRLYLLGQAAALRACDAVDGVLAYTSAFSETVRVSEIHADLGDSTDELRWTLQAEMLKFPSGDYVEANWKVAAIEDTANSELITRVSGQIRAHDEASALAKRDALRASFEGSGSLKLYKGGEWEQTKLDGSDGATDTHSWDFSISYREPLPGAVASYTLRVTSRIDETTGLVMTTYAGRVTAGSTSAAVAKARVLGQNQLPMKLSEEEDVETISLAGSAEQHIQVTFAYSYESRGTERHAEVTSETEKQTFGANVQTVTGWAVAVDAATALTFARTFKVTGILVVSERESDAEDYHGTSGQLFKRITFAYSYRVAAAVGSLDYAVKTEDDFTTRETITTYSGTARAVDAATADALITSLVSGLTGRWVTNLRETHTLSGNTNLFDCRTFTIAKAGALSNDEDILEAEVTITTVPSIAKAVITPIPYGTPYVQANVGQTSGTMVASGSVTAVNSATAITWARSWVLSGGYTTQQPQEAKAIKFRPRSGGSIACYRVSFNYPVEFASLSFT